MIKCFEKFNIEDIEKALNRDDMYLGVMKYKFIMDTFWYIDCSTNNTFKAVFTDFYKLNVGAEQVFLDRFFYCLEYHKNTKLSFIEVLRYLYKYSKKVHGSFASKLLATVNPKLPIIDKFIRNHLELETYYGTKNVDKVVEQYYQIITIYEGFLKTEQAKLWINLFDEKFPNNNIENIKKIDFILWQIR